MKRVNVEVVDLYESDSYDITPPQLVLYAADREIEILNFRNYYFTSKSYTLNAGNQPKPNEEAYSNMAGTIAYLLKIQYDINVQEFIGNVELIEKFAKQTYDYYGCYV